MAAMQRLKLLWQGYLPLETAFWHYAIFYGLLLNALATALALAFILIDLPIAYAMIVHLLPVPYSVLVTIGVWRSADRYGSQGRFAPVARVSVLAWFIFWFVF